MLNDEAEIYENISNYVSTDKSHQHQPLEMNSNYSETKMKIMKSSVIDSSRASDDGLSTRSHQLLNGAH
jgi:hypothetical protein